MPKCAKISKNRFVKYIYFNSKQAVVVLPVGSPKLDRSRLYEPGGNSDTDSSDAGSSDVGSELKHSAWCSRGS